ncbi:MAG: TenA family protein [Cohaesibacter sp.]|nr:TenA family protein [Cohaesibacter sp.]
MRPSDYLRSLADEDWQAATHHAFCKELADGSLPLDKMRYYLVQDYKFVDGFVRLLASTIAHAPTLADSVPAAQFLAVITGPENTYFLRSFEALQISEDAQNAPASPVTTAFQDIMAKAAKSGSYLQMLAVLNVAEWSYLTWATPFNPPAKDLPFWFAEWITLHAGEGFEGVVAYLREQLDQAWDKADEADREAAKQLFIEAVSLERQFFDLAYQTQ